MGDTLDAIEESLGGVVFAIEMVTFGLFFFEESYVNMIRAYKNGLYTKELGFLLVFNRTNWDHILNLGLMYLNHFGKIAVYSYKAFSAFFFMCAMWRSYGDYILTGKRGKFDITDHVEKYIVTYDHDDTDPYLSKIWTGKIE